METAPKSTTKNAAEVGGNKDPTAVSRLVLERLDRRRPANNIEWGRWLVYTKEFKGAYHAETIQDILDQYTD